MSIVVLPIELLLQIANDIDDEATLNGLVLANTHLYKCLNDYLYRRNITHNDSSALIWGATHGIESTVRRMLSLGADTQSKASKGVYSEIRGTYWNAPFSALDAAALSGHVNIMRLLLSSKEEHISPSGSNQIFMPLYYALENGHDDAALLLMERIGTDDRVTWAPQGITTLHVASCLGLPELVRHLLGRGSDVHLSDIWGMTPLHYALMAEKAACRSCSRIPLGGMKKRVTFLSKGKGYAADIETVRLLLQAGADPELVPDTGHSIHRHSPKKLARKHPDKRMYRLFVEPAWAVAMAKLARLCNSDNSG